MGNDSPLSIDSYMVNLARITATRAVCQKRKVGAVLAFDRRVVSVGYNGTPRGMSNCLGEGCKGHDGSCISTIHAEANAIVRAVGKQVDTAYCTDHPCLSCLKLLLAFNPAMRIVYWRPHNDPDCDHFIASFGLENQVQRIDPRVLEEALEVVPPMKGEKT